MFQIHPLWWILAFDFTRLSFTASALAEFQFFSFVLRLRFFIEWVSMGERFNSIEVKVWFFFSLQVGKVEIVLVNQKAFGIIYLSLIQTDSSFFFSFFFFDKNMLDHCFSVEHWICLILLSRTRPRPFSVAS